jgi:hypothetical protein
MLCISSGEGQYLSERLVDDEGLADGALGAEQGLVVLAAVEPIALRQHLVPRAEGHLADRAPDNKEPTG